MATNKDSNVIIIPSHTSSLATALRGHVNAVLAYSRIGEAEHMEEAIRCMRRDMAALERAVRSTTKGA